MGNRMPARGAIEHVSVGEGTTISGMLSILAFWSTLRGLPPPIAAAAKSLQFPLCQVVHHFLVLLTSLSGAESLPRNPFAFSQLKKG